MKLTDWEWSTRAQNCLAESGITTWKQLAALTYHDIAGKRHAGPKTIREFIAGCVRNGIRPAALGGIIELGRHPVQPGMVQLAVFCPGERPMFEAAVALLNEWGVQLEPDGLHLCVPSTRFVDDGPEVD